MDELQPGARVLVTPHKSRIKIKGSYDPKEPWEGTLIEVHLEGVCWIVRSDDGSEWDVLSDCIKPV